MCSNAAGWRCSAPREGLFVAARLAKTDVEVLTFPIIVLLLMVYGALGAYLGIDMPAAALRRLAGPKPRINGHPG